jgi:hypothetical protein
MTPRSSPTFARRLSQIFKPSSRSDFSSEKDVPANSDAQVINPHTLRAGIMESLKTQAKRIPDDLTLLLQLIETEFHGGYEDDSKFVVCLGASARLIAQLEHLIQLVASLPPGYIQTHLTSSLVGKLWNNLLHPPLSYLGDEAQYRSADGANNVLPCVPQT